ncbi:hypothetical protein [Streptomyces griseocarneus]|uniref:Uncharacterized protein n=1 Tax=Streptomyces griseocarneus TaxID=51201 RepID=A0ABX7RQX6_9ACTN|nr:hypothetical protein [Streptomyces griseocarneus]QSY50672.1 hypothetical protein J3S04_06950 [Streptomyces griseocarneus]
MPARRSAENATGGNRRERRRQPPERVVHVSIGRLEVTAGRRPGPAQPAGRPGTGDGGRTKPAMTLDRYLAREKGQQA